MAPKAKALNGKAPAPQQTQQQSPPQQKQPQAQPKQQAPQPKQQPASKAAAEAPAGAPAAKAASKAQPKQQTQQAQAKQPPSKAAEPTPPKAAQPKQQAAPAKAEGAAPKAASKAQPKSQPQQAQPKQPASKAAQAKPPPVAAAPAAVEPVVADDGFGEVARRKKRRNNKKAAETFAEDPGEMSPPEDRQEENCSEEVMAMMALEKSRLEASLKATTDVLRKEIEAIPEVADGGTVNDVDKQRKAIDRAVQEIEKALLANKVSRPKRTNTRLIMQQMEEFQKCKTASSNISEETRKEMLKDAEDTLKQVMSWEAYKDFQAQLNELKASCEKRLKVNDDVASKVRSGNSQRKMVQRVAAVKGVEGLDADKIVSTPLELDAQVATLPWLLKRFEKSHGVVIDRVEKQGSKLLARGLKADVDAAVAALKAVDCSVNKALSVTDRQAAQVMGAQQSNARKIEEMFKGVYLHSEQNKVTVFGSKTQVPLCVKHLEGIIAEQTTAPQQPQTTVKEMSIDKDRARALIGLHGSKVKDLEAETGTQIKVNKPAAEENDTVPVKISGEKSKVATAGQRIEAFLKSLEGLLVPATLEVINRLYDTGGKSKGGGKGGKSSKNSWRGDYAQPSEVASKFAALRETPGLTVTRKADGIHLLGTKDVVSKSKETLEDCLKEASNTPLMVSLTFPQGRLWTSERCASTSASSGAQVKIVKRVREVLLEVSGTQEQKDAAEAAINEVNEAHQEVLTHSVTIDIRSLTGKYGERIQEIERSCDVAITMDKRNQAVKIHGSKESTEQAKEQIEKFLAEVPPEETAETAETEQPSQAAPSNGTKHGSTARDRDRDGRDRDGRDRETKPKGGNSEAAAASAASSSSYANHGSKQQAKAEKAFVAADGDFPTLGGPSGEGGKAPQRPMGAWASS
mmetsp:Transcript_37696/g.68699  ORF Transcript_37696/g.68699 Transcript_37696/m.68699 type:complete len:913 (+) Transcript_37696:76-2814(+)